MTTVCDLALRVYGLLGCICKSYAKGNATILLTPEVFTVVELLGNSPGIPFCACLTFTACVCWFSFIAGLAGDRTMALN